jgi:antitoxin HicB
MRTPYSYPATMQREEDGRYLVRFPDLPEALTDGVDEAEALAEAADCLSEALASRIVDGEVVPLPTPLEEGQCLISPDPTVALKAALYTTLRRRGMTVADLADRLGLRDWHQAARLIDPKRPSKLSRLTEALDALGCAIEIAVSERKELQRAPHKSMIDALRTAILGRLSATFSREQLADLNRRGELVDIVSMMARNHLAHHGLAPDRDVLSDVLADQAWVHESLFGAESTLSERPPAVEAPPTRKLITAT